MRYVVFLLIATLLSACGNQHEDPSSCKTKEACLSDPNCGCWCSVKCGFRKKTEMEHLVYIENDPNGKHCYCKQWDVDHYQENCLEGQKIPEPPNSK